MLQSNALEVVERQSAIISAQSEIISDLFELLSQHVTTEELSALSKFANENNE